MRIFFDTNVLVAAFVTRGASTDVFEYCLFHHTIVISEFVLEEFERVMTKKFRFSPERVEQILCFLRRELAIVVSTDALVQLCCDPDDDQILADAQSSQVELLLTGDQDLLILGKTVSVQVLSPSDFWKFEGTD